ncbi:hypothetical protein [Streptomyces echinatus]|uniref:hypothetical protein n=1 Tax=Streptomyces echinatus TaxID=67293 RepID=UPI0031E755B6
MGQQRRHRTIPARPASANSPSNSPCDIGSEPGETHRAVRNALRRGEPYANWLLVFDGWDDIEAVSTLLPRATVTS